MLNDRLAQQESVRILGPHRSPSTERPLEIFYFLKNVQETKEKNGKALSSLRSVSGMVVGRGQQWSVKDSDQ